MKKTGKFYRNPAPYALTAINPAKKRRRRKAARRGARKNPAIRRKVGTRGWHHKRGTFLYNPVKKLKRRRRKNPLEVKHVLVETPAKNPARRKRRRKISSKSTRNPIMSRKRKNRRSRNPARSHSRRGRSHRRRNPSRRRGRIMRRRNPVPILSEVATQENVMTGVGVLAGIAGTRLLVNRLIQGDPTTGARMFDLPGVTYSTATAPLTQQQFAAKNKIALAIYETLIPAVAGWLTRNVNGPISRGLFQSSIVNLGIAAIRGTDIGTSSGLNAFLPRQRGLGTAIPGVPAMLSGPGTAFITSGAPVPAGLGAAVDRSWLDRTTNRVADPFRKS